MIAALAWLAAIALPAAEPPPTLLVAPVPAKAQWTFAVAAGNREGPPGTREIKEVRTAKTGPIRRDVAVYTDGSTEEAWYFGAMLLSPEDDGTVAIVDLAAAGEDAGLMPAVGFPGFGWLHHEYYRGAVLFEKQPCDHFVLDGEGSEEAWVAAQTRLPVAFRRQGVLYRYQFGPAPAAPLNLPARLAAAAQAYEDRLQRRKRLESDLRRP